MQFHNLASHFLDFQRLAKIGLTTYTPATQRENQSANAGVEEE